LTRYDKPEKYEEVALNPGLDEISEYFENAIQTSRQFGDISSESQLSDCYNQLKTGLSNDFLSLPCYIPWYSTMISINGDVYPCCCFYDGQVVLGNIFEEDFSRIWNNDKYQQFRADLKNSRGKYAPCRTCGWTDWKFQPILDKFAKFLP